MGPDLAVGELALPAIAAAGAVAGGLLGAALAAPLGLAMPIGAAVGAGVGAAIGVSLGQRFYHWYQYEATAEERARLRMLGLKILKGGGPVFEYGKGAYRFYEASAGRLTAARHLGESWAADNGATVGHQPLGINRWASTVGHGA